MSRSTRWTLGLFAALFGLTELAFHLPSFQIRAENFLTGEPSINFWLADELNHGKALYRDVFTQYGPLPAYLYAWVASIFGNTPMVYLRLQQILELLNAGLVWILLQRHLRLERAALFLLLYFGAYASLTLPVQTYREVEISGILLLALLWRPAVASPLGLTALTGAVMGALQLVKFGGGIVALAAWVLADLCLAEGPWLLLLRGWVALAGGLIGVTVFWAIFLLCWLPRQVAVDVICPIYMLSNYASYLAPEDRWPHFSNWHYFFGVQIIPLLAFVLFAGTAVQVLFFRGRGPAAEARQGAGPFLFLGFFFVVGSAVYFKHVWLVMDHFWLLALASAWAWSRLPFPARAAVTAAFLLVVFIHLRWLALPAPAEYAEIILTPSGDRLYATAAQAHRIRGIEAAVDGLIARGQGQDAVMVVPLGAGWHHFFRWPDATRHYWYMVGFIRSYDEPVLFDSLQRTAAVVVMGDKKSPTADPLTWNSYSYGFPESVRQALIQRLGKPVTIDDTCHVFPVLPDVNAGP